MTNIELLTQVGQLSRTEKFQISAIFNPRSTGIFVLDRTTTGKPMGASVSRDSFG
ncbi:hypothetical protein [Pseudanabaena sp. lw0831]|uniref:hypothetical protein n=1 Tax=Pseudanabaena sp. lw0831 TaxID=1357935 RepID=UPI0019155570|nr:hypothetical protein [Pseudanabaena sp. lw0831]